MSTVATEVTGGVVTTGSISSTVVLDYGRGTAHKTYEPPFWVRALYRLAFQAPFPYTSNHAALEAARQRRRIVGILTKYWFGQDLVAPMNSTRGSELPRRGFFFGGGERLQRRQERLELSAAAKAAVKVLLHFRIDLLKRLATL